MFKKILHPVDLNESLTEIKIRASFLYKMKAEDMVFFHVLNPGLGGHKHAESRLRHFQSALDEVGINVHYKVEEGHVASEITREAREQGADLIYIPARGRNFLMSSLLGSTTQDVVRLADSPVWVHKKRPDLRHEEQMHRIVFATDFQQAAEKCCQPVFFLGELVPELVVLHVGERAADPYSEQLRREHVNVKLEELKEQYSGYYRKVRQISRIGSPASHILDVVDEIQADAVILGRLNEPFPLHVMGSTCARVVSRVNSSVLLIP
ncbi:MULTISPECIES: universal stress protein [unclassified Desulfonatronospira]|uniref:universal stress protein n=1 Tax=unclassified Desulfonatronospira TaxID=2629452 RepID=UPI00257E5898|nr:MULTISPECIES: universal stress protein [unclassified Desulfonatronospira]